MTQERSIDERPKVVVFDVNETLSDTPALADSFKEVGVPGHLAATWFAQVLRDGFALTATSDNVAFATIAATLLDSTLSSVDLTPPVEEAKKVLLDSFAQLPLHPGVAPGLRDLAAACFRLVTLSNGASAVAGSLFQAADVDGLFDHLVGG
jgi:2-haloacid dehalogenase